MLCAYDESTSPCAAALCLLYPASKKQACFLLLQQDIDVKGARGPHGEFGASGFVDVDQNARDVYQFMSRIEDQPSWYQGVKACEVLDVSGTTKRVKQVPACTEQQHGNLI